MASSTIARRHLFALSAAAVVGSPSRVRSESSEDRLGSRWIVPRGATVVLRPRQIRRSLAEILNEIDEWTIPPSARVVIQLDDGEYDIGATIVFRHQFGARVSIIGNRQDPAKCRLTCGDALDAIYVGAGSVLGLIDGITLEHVARARRGLKSALLADETGVIICGSMVRVVGFYYGFQARRNGVIRADRTQARDGGDANYFAFLGGQISASGARALAARDLEKNLGSGFVAEYGGSIDAQNASASYNLLAGFTALSNGVIRAYGALATNNGAGYRARTGGRIIAHDGRAAENCGSGVATDRDGRLEGSRFTEAANNLPASFCMPP